MLLLMIITLPLLAAPLVYFLGRASPRAARWATLLITCIVFLASFQIYLAMLSLDPGTFQFLEHYSWIDFFGIEVSFEVAVDGISASLLLLSTALNVLATAGSFTLVKANERQYYSLLLLFAGGVAGVFTALNLILFFVFWELAIIPMFFFIGIWGGPRRKYAAIKFLLFTTLGSLLMLIGFFAVFLWSGGSTFDIPALITNRLPQELQLLPAILCFIGFAIKLPVIPFHTWLPDAHVEAPSPISVLLAGVMLKMGGYGIIRIIIGLFREFAIVYGQILIILSLASVLFAAFTAMFQDDLKRMVALTSINHMGFVAVGAFTVTSSGIAGAVLQMFCHGFAIGLLFLLTGVIQKGTGTRKISQLHALGAGMTSTSILLILGSLASMGIPGFGNFIAEFSVIQAAIGVQWVFGILVLGPGVTAAYFLWTLQRIFRQTQPASIDAKPASTGEILTLALFVVPILILGIFPYLLMNLIYPATVTLLNSTGGP
ncbi:MAG: NuoM family protein [Candidatus Hodarchaeota archaeon]